MCESVKVIKLIQKIQLLATRLEKTREFKVHRHISQFYYMQKATELNVLREQLEETQQKISLLASRINEEYSNIFNRWSHDIRWLQHYEMNTKNNS